MIDSNTLIRSVVLGFTCSFLAFNVANANVVRTYWTENGLFIADYRPGNIPPADAIHVLPGQGWSGRIELDSDDQDLKIYIENPSFVLSDPMWRR